MLDPVVVKLSEPVRDHGDEVTELRFDEEPLALHIIDAQIVGNRIEQEVLLIALLAKVRHFAILKLTRSDFLRATAAVKQLIGIEDDEPDTASPDDPLASRTVRLSRPISNKSGAAVTELVLREPRVSDLMEAAEADDDNALAERARVIASIAGVPYAELRNLPAADFVRLLGAADPFFMVSPGTGAS